MQVLISKLDVSKNVSRNYVRNNGDSGFTLIELLTVVGIIGILASLALTSFSVYRASAAYAVANSTYRSARNALEAALSDPNNLPGAVASTSITAPGPVTIAGANTLMPGMQLPKNIKVVVAYDPSCQDASCTESFLSARHCMGKQYLYWFRRGDGVESLVEKISGAGCP